MLASYTSLFIINITCCSLPVPAHPGVTVDKTYAPMLQAIIFKETISRIEAFTNEQGLQSGTVQTQNTEGPYGTNEPDRETVTGAARAEHGPATPQTLQTEPPAQHTSTVGTAAPAASRLPATFAQLQPPAAEDQQPAPDLAEADKCVPDPDGDLLETDRKKGGLAAPVAVGSVQSQHLDAAAAAAGSVARREADAGQGTLVFGSAAQAALLPVSVAPSGQVREDAVGKVQASVGEEEGVETGEGEDDTESLQKTVAALAMGSDAIARYGLVLQPGADRQGMYRCLQAVDCSSTCVHKRR